MFRPVLTALLLTPLVGCVASVEHIAEDMALKSVESQHDMTVFEGDLAAFRACLQHHGNGGTCDTSATASLLAPLSRGGTPAQAGLSPEGKSAVDALPDGHPAKIAHEAISDPTVQQAVDLHNHLRGHGSGSLPSQAGTPGSCSKLGMSVSIQQAVVLHDKILRSTAAGGWKALQEHTAEVLARSKAGEPEHEAKVADHRKATFLKYYMEAFLRDGHFIGVDFEIDEAAAVQAIAEELAKHSKIGCQVYNVSNNVTPTDTTGVALCTGLATSIYKTATGGSASDCQDPASDGYCKQLVKVATTGFVSRDGSFAAKVPSLSVDIDPTAPRLVTFTAAPLANGKVDYTQIGTDLVRVLLEAIFDAHEGLPAVPTATGQTVEVDGQPLLPPIPSSMTAHVNAMQQKNNDVQIATGVLFDRIIQGIGPLSLNNRALEQLITTMVTTSARKAAEKATWCWYACNLDEDVHALAGDAKTALQAEAQKARDELKEKALAEAEHVCLAFSSKD